jgi:predicted Rossmann fold flavoprotein
VCSSDLLGVNIVLSSRCASVLTRDGTAAGVMLDSGELRADAVILATGGNSWPATGSDWSGCRIAEKLGHAVSPPVPGLVGLRTSSVDAELAGLILPRARVSFKAKGSKEEVGTGELLVTHTGLSGPSVLDLSASVCKAVAERDSNKEGGDAILRVQWVDGLDSAEWRNLFENWRGTRGKAQIASLVREHVPQRLAKWLCGKAGIDPDCAASAVRADARDRLLALLAAFPAAIVSGEGWNKAMITRGGVDVRQINPETLESKIVRNLYFAGEMIDMDGPCGGYNLHWAFAGGALAGASAAVQYGIRATPCACRA